MEKYKIKIVEIIADAKPGGGTSHVLNLLKKLDKDKFECYLICPAGDLSSKVKDIKGVEVANIDMISKTDLVSIYETKKEFERIQSTGFPFGPMIIHSHGPRAGFFTYLVGPRAAIKIYTEHSYNELYHIQGRINGWLQKKLLKSIYKKNKAIVAVSTSVKNFLIKLQSVKASKVLVIPNGIDLEEIEKSSKKIKEINKAPVIGTVGNLYKLKGQKYLIQAMKGVVERFPFATLEIIGEGPERADLDTLIEESKLERHVTLLGQKSNIYEYMKHWDLFVLPSLSETFGITILEAYAAGVPVVATKTGGITDIVEHKKSGLLVESKNPKALSDAIIEILDHPAEASKLKHGGLERVKHFDWNKVIKEIEDLYLSLVK